MRKWLMNLKFARKIFFLVMLIVLSFWGTEILNRQRMYDEYNQKINEQNAQIIGFYANYIVTVFERIEALTYSISGDQNLREELEYIKENYRKSGYSINLRSANSRIRTYFQKEPYFKSFLLETDVYRFNYGVALPQEEKIDQYMEYGKNASGKQQLIEEENQLCVVREIRKLAGSEYVHVGYILGIINFEKIITDMRNTFANNNGEDIDFAIYSEDICLYSNSKELKEYELYKDGWYSVDDDFIVVYTPEELGYKMILRNHYTEMQREIRHVYTNSLLISMLVMIVAIIVSNYVIKQVIGQLESIVVKMDAYGKGALFSREEEELYLERKDEIGQLYQHFYQMVNDYKKLTDAYYENEMILKEMEFSYLQKQIQPHFLYNTLSAMSWMAYSNDDEETAHMIERLGKMMRIITDQKEKIISVDQDLQIAKDYLEMVKLRVGSRLEFSIEISEQTRNMLIPKITIQPLVENSVIHGLDKTLSDYTIRIFEIYTEDMLEIVVEDTGPGFEENILENEIHRKKEGTGIALKNIQYRLRYVFSEKSGLKFVKSSNGMQVRVLIPKDALVIEKGREINAGSDNNCISR